MIVALLSGCTANKTHSSFSYQEKLEGAHAALMKGRLFEARRLTTQILNSKPNDPKAQKLMAHVITHEIAREKILERVTPPDELTSTEKKLQIKTWLERSRELAHRNEFDEALQAINQVFQLDPENLEASRLIDEIKDKARRQGRDENRFLEDLYQQEADSRIQRYTRQAEDWIEAGKWGAARFAVEKILFLDPQNSKGQKLLSLLDKKDGALNGR